MKKEILSKHAPTPIGAYSQAVSAEGFVFISGQIPLDPASGAMVDGAIEAQAKQVMENIGAILEECGLGFSDVVKTTIYLKNLSDFAAVNAVYEKYVVKPYPARATVEVSGLPKGALVEIDAVACRK